MVNCSRRADSFFCPSWNVPNLTRGAALLAGVCLTAYGLKLGVTAAAHWAATPPKRELLGRPIKPVSIRLKLRAWLNPLTYLSALVSKIYCILMAPYWLLFGEKEYWMNQIPAPVHYNAFRRGGNLALRAEHARRSMKALLESMGASNFSPRLSSDGLPSWSGVDALKLPDGRQFSCGSFDLTSEEIAKQASSLKVSYDPAVISPKELCTTLTNGARSPKQKSRTRGRMVSSLVTSVCDSRGNPIQRKDTLPYYRIYTSNAPNLAYSAYDRADFVNRDGTLNEQKYTKELGRIFAHYFSEAKANGDRVVVLSGFGMGAFMTPELLPSARKCFVRALRGVTDAQRNSFDKIIFADPNKQLTASIKTIPHITVTNKSCLDVAHHGAKRGYKIALFNPGDGSGIPGQFWLDGHVALEEMFGLFTTLLLGQHPNCNPLVKDRTRYRAFDQNS